MNYKKKYDHKKPYKKVICVDNKDAKLLKRGERNVIDETQTKYLIQFQSGAAHWYSKERFEEIPQPKKVQLNQLF